MKQHELRTLNCELRAQDKMTLVGRAVTYGALSGPIGNFRERVLPGAFTKSLNSGANVIADWNHDDKALPLGTTDAGTLTLKDGPEGLDFRCVLDPNQEAHRALYSSVKRGDTKSCSWAFSVDGEDGDAFDTDVDEQGNHFNRRSVKRANLYGISIVNRPAYPGDATSVAARSAAKQLVNRPFQTNKKSYEQMLAESRGYDEGLMKMRAYRIGLEIRVEQRRLSEMRAEEKSRRERIAALVERIHDAAEGVL